MKKVLFIVITIAVSTAIPFVLAEITLRFLPVSTSLFGQPVNETSPVFRFLPDRDYLWSRDWNFSIVNGGHVNSSGFVSDRDYETDTTSPLLAVIGDSYVEATMVPYAETLQGRLAATSRGTAGCTVSPLRPPRLASISHGRAMRGRSTGRMPWCS
jgi:hypothetical protein